MDEDGVDYYKTLMDRAARDAISPNFMQIQTIINDRMRKIVIDWLMAVNAEFNLLPETHLLACHLFDLYCSKVVIDRKDVQLVGTTCLFMAHKYEEVKVAFSDKYANIMDNTWKGRDIRLMEQKIINEIQFKLAFPTSFYFLRCLGEVVEQFEQIEPFCLYLLQLCTLDVDTYQFHPAQLAASSIYLANKLFKRTLWDENLEKYSSFSEETIKSSASLMNEMRKKLQKLEYISLDKSLDVKYKDESFINIENQTILDEPEHVQ